jgi:hypothetical protein
MGSMSREKFAFWGLSLTANRKTLFVYKGINRKTGFWQKKMR